MEDIAGSTFVTPRVSLLEKISSMPFCDALPGLGPSARDETGAA